MDERGFFDKLAPTWDDNEIYSTSQKVNSLLDLIDIKEGESILDLGTGTGILLPYLAERIGKSGNITAVDYSEGMLSRAKEKFSGIEPKPLFLNLDFENENIPGEYDKIILYCVYPHLHQPYETLKWLKSVNLKNGGEILIAFPTGPEQINNIHRERHSESDFLPEASVLSEKLRQMGFNAMAENSADDIFLVKIKKIDS